MKVSDRIQRCRLIAFDLDGTLLDSLPDIAASLNAVRKHCGLPDHPLPVVRRGIGAGARKLLERTMDDAVAAGHTIDALYDRLIAEYRIHCEANPCLYPGALAFLDFAARRQQLAILTNKPLEITHRTLDALGISQRFVAIVAPENARAAKPDPAGMLGLLEDQGVAAEDAVLVGDSSNDFGAGRGADVFTIGMKHGYHDDRAPEPDLWVDDFASLIELWAMDNDTPPPTGRDVRNRIPG